MWSEGLKKKFFLPIDFSWSICWEKWLRFDEKIFSNLRKNHKGGPFWFFNLIFKKLINNWFLSQKRHFHFIFTVFDHEESIGDVFGSNFLVEKIIFFKKIDKNGKICVFSTKYNILSKYFAPKQVPFDSPLLKTGIHA